MWQRRKKVKAIMFSKDNQKYFLSPKYNWRFDRITGQFIRWGETEADDPDYSPIGPEIADIEISAGKCSGCGTDEKDSPCRWCYKNNGGEEIRYMTLETFKKIFTLINCNGNITQFAAGITDIDANPEIWDIFKYCRENDVVPNITINGNKMTTEIYDNLAKYCGAVAVSHYNDDRCFNAVRELTSRGLTQINIHKMLSLESYDSCLELIDKAKSDERLKNLNAIVFLALKPKGRGANLTPLKDVEKYKILVEKAIESNIGIGFDSCSAPLFLSAMKGHPNYESFEQLAESCESNLFSIYIDVDGNYWPCSFCEGVEKTLNGVSIKPINVLEVNDFMKEVWLAPQTVEWRKNLLETSHLSHSLCAGCRQCPVYDITPLPVEDDVLGYDPWLEEPMEFVRAMREKNE